MPRDNSFLSGFGGAFGAIMAVFASLAALAMVICTGFFGIGLLVSSRQVSSEKPAVERLGPYPVGQRKPRDQAALRARLEKELAAMEALEITSSSFYWTDETFPSPGFAIRLTNHGQEAVKRVSMDGVLISPDRTIPWVESGVNYEPPGGIEPGESVSWELTANRFGDWSKAPRERDDLKLTLSVRSYETASGSRVVVAASRAEEIRQELAIIEAASETPASPGAPQ